MIFFILILKKAIYNYRILRLSLAEFFDFSWL